MKFELISTAITKVFENIYYFVTSPVLAHSLCLVVRHSVYIHMKYYDLEKSSNAIDRTM